MVFSTPRRRHFWQFILAVCALTFLLGVVATVASTRQAVDEVRKTQLDGTPLGKQLAASADRILDCTDAGDKTTGRPPGKCYIQNQKSTAEAIGNINRVAVLAAACAAGLPEGLSDQQRVVRVQTCLINQLATEKQ